MFGRHMNFMTEDFTNRDVENLVGCGLVVASFWFYYARRDDDDEGPRNVTPG
jgi:hypothetical protein